MWLHKIILSGLVGGSLAGATIKQHIDFPVPAGNNRQLFYLQRTPNTNTIVYELNLKNGQLDMEHPVEPVWLRYQENGQREALSFIQKKFAYGIKSKKLAENQFELSFVSYKKYKMYLRLGADKKYHVFTNINQQQVLLTRIFIQINGGSFWSPNIEYVELTGIEPTTKEIVKERLKI